VAQQAIDPHADYTQGIAPAIADSIRSSNGSVNSSHGDSVTASYKNGMVENNRSYDIRVEIVVAYIDNIDVQQILAHNGAEIIPGYEPANIRIPRRASAMVLLKPGDYDVRVYNLNRQAGKSLEFNGILHVDRIKGANVNQTYDFVFSY
jgi:hypothetical protein